MHVHKKSLPLASIDEDDAQYTKVDQPIPPFLYQSDTSHTLIYKSEPPFFTFHTHINKSGLKGLVRRQSEMPGLSNTTDRQT